MTVKRATLEELAGIAEAYHLDPTMQDLESFRGLMAGVLASYARLDQLAEPTLPVKYRGSRATGRGPKTTRSAPGIGGLKSRALRTAPGRQGRREPLMTSGELRSRL